MGMNLKTLVPLGLVAYAIYVRQPEERPELDFGAGPGIVAGDEKLSNMLLAAAVAAYLVL